VQVTFLSLLARGSAEARAGAIQEASLQTVLTKVIRLY
jgi:hypothetical protein